VGGNGFKGMLKNPKTENKDRADVLNKVSRDVCDFGSLVRGRGSQRKGEGNRSCRQLRQRPGQRPLSPWKARRQPTFSEKWAKEDQEKKQGRKDMKRKREEKSSTLGPLKLSKREKRTGL